MRRRFRGPEGSDGSRGSAGRWNGCFPRDRDETGNAHDVCGERQNHDPLLARKSLFGCRAVCALCQTDPGSHDRQSIPGTSLGTGAGGHAFLEAQSGPALFAREMPKGLCDHSR